MDRLAPMTFTLRRIIWDDGKPSMDPEDYSVVVDGKIAGRIYRVIAPGGQLRWFWSVYDSDAAGLSTASRMPRRRSKRHGNGASKRAMRIARKRAYRFWCLLPR